MKPLLLTILLVVSGCAAWSPLPEERQTSDRLQSLAQMPAPPFERSVTIHWNDALVPFVEAETDRDAAMALGLIHAHLRLGQMEFGKRVIEGRLSEMTGPFATDVDAGLRALGFKRAAAEIIAGLPDETRVWLEAYVAGVNHYKRHLSEPPHEMVVLDLDDEPWTVADTIGLGRLGAADPNWFALFALLPQRSEPHWPDLWRRLAETQRAKTASFKAEGVQAAREPGDWQALARLVEPFAKSGSNSFAVSSGRSRSGAPLIANDPHLGFAIPNLWLIAGLKSPGYHVVGMMPAGIPVFAFGRNAHIAWGGTNMRQWSSDLVDVTGAAGLREERHGIARRAFWDAEVGNRMSAYGPVISDADIIPVPADKDIALRWMGHRPSDETTAMLGVAKARSWQEMRAALTGFAVPGQNFIFADTQGNIGHILAAWLPKRDGAYPRDLWVTPAESDATWRTILTTRDLPYIVNPEDGVIASANNRPVDVAPTRISWLFPLDDRIRRLYGLLAAQETWSLSELRDVQLDAFSPSHHALSRALLRHARDLSLSVAARQTLAAIAAWDGHYRIDSKGAYVYQAWLTDFAPQLYAVLGRPYEAELWRRNTYLPQRLVDDMAGLAASRRAALIAASLERAVPAARDGKRWGDVHRVKVEHVLARVPLIGDRYTLYDLPVPGAMETVLKSAGTLSADRHFADYGAQARHLSDLSDPNANYFVLFGGQDGVIGSANFVDQVELWARGDFVQVPLDLDRVRTDFAYRTAFAGRAP